jgi:hypothetical protein
VLHSIADLRVDLELFSRQTYGGASRGLISRGGGAHGQSTITDPPFEKWPPFENLILLVLPQTDVFQKNEINLLRKLAKIVIIFDKIDDSKNQGVI